MFGFISKKKLEKAMTEIYQEERTDKAWSENNLYYRMGNANAINALVYMLKLHPPKEPPMEEDDEQPVSE